MQQLEINQSREVKRCALFQLHRVTTPAGEKLLFKSLAFGDSSNDLIEREQQIFSKLTSLRVARAVGLVHVREQQGACYADFPGAPLSSARPRDANELVQLTIELCSILDDFHAAGLLVLGLSPNSFLSDGRGRLQLVDAPFAQPRARATGHDESEWIQSPFLPYAAPEAFRALGRALDRAADMYALGALLYELLGGSPPFATTDPAELIQSHLARKPQPLVARVPGVPTELTDAVMQLLAKNPAQRPASPRDFLHTCKFGTPRTEAGDEVEGLRASDSRQLPVWSTRFYGREALLLELRSTLEESAHSGITFIQGDPGSGKTSVLEELRKAPFVTNSCWGKFTLGAAGQPLSGWVAIARALAAAALSADPVEFAALRDNVEEALGASAPALVSLAEEWDGVLGCGAAGKEHFEGGLNRTAIALQRLLGCYADAAAPMWVFLDDLQWADPSSLRILELILTLPNCPNLRILASVRLPKPAEDRSELVALTDALERSGVEVNAVELDGLVDADLRALVNDSLGLAVDGLDDLLGFLLDKTRGNPFFVRELLYALARENALVRGAESWHWSASALHIALPDSLLELLMQRVHQFSSETKALLTAAACIGEGARLLDLCAVTKQDVAEVSERMERVVAAGLMHQQRTDDYVAYAFAHDRILEASLALTSEAERVALSIRLFHLLSLEATKTDRQLTFTLANLFNTGRAEIHTESEWLAGVYAYQAAGEAAKAKGAYSQALLYSAGAVAALQQLPADSRWGEHRMFTRSVYGQAAEAALLCNHFEQTAELCRELLAQSNNTLEKAVGYEFWIRALAAQKRYGEAVEMALQAQAELKVRFPRNPTMAHVIWGYVRTLRRIKALGADRLSGLPPRENEVLTVASRLMQTAFAVTHFHKPELYPLFVFRQVEQCVTYGNDAYSPQLYSACSMILAGLGEVQLANRLGKISLSMPSTPAGEKLRCRALFSVASFVDPWLLPVRKTFPQLVLAGQTALEHGDFEFFGYAITMRGLGQLYTASTLAELTVEFEQGILQLQALGQERSALMQSIMCEAAHELRYGAPQGVLNGRFYQRVEGLGRCRSPMDHTLVFHHYLAQVCVAAHLGDVPNALEAVGSVKAHVANGAFASYLLAPFLFYEAWVLGVSVQTAGYSRLKARRRLKQSFKQLLTWCKGAGVNFLSKLHFIKAERFRLSHSLDEAARCYNLAIDEARTQGYLNEAALAHERTATLWLERGFPRNAGQHVREAHSLYRQWGALAAAERLRSAHPQHLSLLPARSDGTFDSTRPSENLDYRALLKASQAISGEMLQPRLLERLLGTIMEHTAAQRGVLLLERRSELFVEASADVDSPQVQLIADETIETTARVSRGIVRYVARLEKSVVLADATEDTTFSRDPYVQAQRPRSVLCAPILYHGKLLGLIYLENNNVGNVFTRARLDMVSLLASQAAISIANARFHTLQLEAQQAKISPHFLFNALSSIAELATVDGMKAESAIVKLSHLYRYILTSSVAQLVPLDRELAIVRDYLSLEKLRFGSKLEFSVTHEGSIETVRVPGLLIQPLVENSIRHAIAPKLEDGKVWVHARVHEGRCNIVVRDDGDGIKHTSSGTGFGLRSVQQRLELVYGDRFSFAISQPGGYRVELEVPLEKSGLLS